MEPSDFDLGPRIGGQKTSEIYIGIHKKTKEEVAYKKESTKIKQPLLHAEAKCLNILQGGTGIPDVYGFQENKDEEYNILLMSLHGPSLEQLFNSCNKKFSLKTVLMLADQMIDRIEFIHSKFLLHRDIVPHNFLMGLNEQRHLVYVVDFARGKRYRTETEDHFPFRHRKRKRPGTILPFESLNYHIEISLTRRDDLESLGYVLMYFLRGRLPFGAFYREVEERLHGKTTSNKPTFIEVLCKGYPSEFKSYFDHCRSLGFDEKPDYAYLKRIFRELFIREGFQMDYVYDWTSNDIPQDSSQHVQQEELQDSSQQVQQEKPQNSSQQVHQQVANQDEES